MKSLLICSMLLLLTSAPVLGHDFWIEPSTFTPGAGELVHVTLRTGEHLNGETVPRNDARIERFAAIDAGGETKVVGIDGQDPAGVLRPAAAGGSMIVYRSLRSRIELEAAQFHAYLELEGLPLVSPGPEVFSRNAKALLAVGGKGASAFTKPAGLKLEIVPETDPYALAGETPLLVQVLYDGKPLPDVLVVALDHGMPDQPQRLRTDAAGRARIALPRSGVWLIKTVHMIAAPQGSGASWESFWASLTFRR